MWNVDQPQFKEPQVDRDCRLQAFCEDHQLDFAKYSVYIERDDFQMEDKEYDVILMDKVVQIHIVASYVSQFSVSLYYRLLRSS